MHTHLYARTHATTLHERMHMFSCVHHCFRYEYDYHSGNADVASEAAHASAYLVRIEYGVVLYFHVHEDELQGIGVVIGEV